MVESKGPAESNPVADCLRAARALIENPDHWFQKSRKFNENKNCTWTAIRGPHQTRAGDLFRVVIGTTGIIAWNDAPERTHAEVLAAFDKAIQLAEAEVRP